MKIFFFFIVLIVSMTMIQAQRPYYRPNIHEFGIQPLGLNYTSASDVGNGRIRLFPEGVRYKYHKTPVAAIRGGLFFRNVNSHDLLGAIENRKYFEARAGYERAYNLKKYQLFAGADLIGGMRNIQGATTSPYYGFSGFVGLKRYFKENFSVTVESNFYALLHNNQGQEKSTISEVGTDFFQIYLSFHSKRQFKSCSCGKPGS